jgi:hypothetical protein
LGLGLPSRRDAIAVYPQPTLLEILAKWVFICDSKSLIRGRLPVDTELTWHALTAIERRADAALMKALHLRIGTALASGILFALVTANAQEAPPAAKASDVAHDAVRSFSEPNRWDLGLNTTDADISPDDRLLAITLESRIAPQRAGGQIVESLEMWDYRQHAKISSTQLATYINVQPTPNAVRFSADGLLIVASDPTRLHVLETATLKSIRLIEPALEDGFRIFHVETSPMGHLVIIAANYYTSGELFAYDLDTGRLLFHWKSLHAVSSISWKQDGTLFAVAAPFLCTRDRDTVHVFSTNPWLHLKTLTARNPCRWRFRRTTSTWSSQAGARVQCSTAIWAWSHLPFVGGSEGRRYTFRIKTSTAPSHSRIADS